MTLPSLLYTSCIMHFYNQYHSSMHICFSPVWSSATLQKTMPSEQLGLLVPINFFELIDLSHRLRATLEERANDYDSTCASSRQWHIVTCWNPGLKLSRITETQNRPEIQLMRLTTRLDAKSSALAYYPPWSPCVELQKLQVGNDMDEHGHQ